VSQSIPQKYDYPNTDWYPRWRCRLTLRFGEFGQIGQLLQLAPTKVTRSLSGPNPSRNALVAVKDPSNPGQYLLVVQGSTASPSPTGAAQVQSSSQDGLTQAIDGVVPTSFRWSQNGPRAGDTLSMTLMFIDCPIDPRTIRSCAVEFYLGTVPAAVAGAQVAGRSSDPSTDVVNTANLVDLLPATYVDSHGNPRTNLRFQGWVDKWHNNWSDGAPTIQLECTDNTRQMITIPAPQKMQISTTIPIDQAIANYLAAFPSLEGLAVQYRPTGATPPTLGNVVTKASVRSGQGQPVRGNASPGAGEKMTLWDHLTDTCRALGHAVYMEGTTIVITRIRSLTSSAIESRADDPYVPRQLPTGEVLQQRRMLFGRNIRELDVERDFVNKPPTNISVRAYDSDQKKVLVERFPLAEDAQVYAIPGNATPDQNWMELTMPGGIKDPATMRIYAQQIYENITRQEIAISVKTDNFASFGGDNEDPDLLDLRFGDALEVVFNAEDFYSSLNEEQKDLDSVALNSQRLQRAGFPQKFADAYATAYTNAGFQTKYRTHQVEISGDAPTSDDAGGVSFDLKLVNYVEVTSDASLAPGEEPTNPPTASPAAPPRAPPPLPGPVPGVGG
jgi:hypothetical protein